MTFSSVLTDYLGEGAVASRPAAPNVAASALSLYYATDTLQLYVWNGAAWVAFTGGTVTSVASGTGLTGGPITASGTLSLASIADSQILANISGGSAAPVANTLTAIIDHAIGNVQGDILYRGASAWSVLAPGSANQVLASGGAAANPAWASISSLLTTPVYNTAASVPAIGGFTLINNATGGFTITQGTLSKVISISSGTTNASDAKLHGVQLAAPVTPYRIAALVAFTSKDGSGPVIAWGFCDGTKYQVGARYGNSGTGPFVFNYTSSTVLSGTAQGPGTTNIGTWTGIYWVGIRNDGTTLFYEWSQDGVNFITVFSAAIAGNFTANQNINFIGMIANASSPAAVAIYVYDQNGLTRSFP